MDDLFIDHSSRALLSFRIFWAYLGSSSSALGGRIYWKLSCNCFPSAPSSSSEQSWFQHVGIPQISDSFITGRSRCDSKQPTEDISPAGSQHQSIRYNIHNSPVPRTQIDLNLLPPSKTPSHQAAKSMQHGRHAHVSFPDISSSCNLCPPESLASLSLTTCQRTRGQP